MEFASDNTSGVAPEIMGALNEAASGFAAAYGDDEWTARLDARFAEVFDHDVRVFPVSTGTAANSLSLSILTPPWGVVLCHEQAHVLVDEAGAPELFTQGARLVGLPGPLGRVDLAALATAVARDGHGVHSSPATVLTLTQATEAGTVYQPDELRARTTLAADRGLAVHLDGARFANAVVATGAHPADLTWRAGIDVMSFGATKNGALGAEAVVVFDTDRVGEIERNRKRTGHLLSKMRYASAQLLAYLDEDLWLRNAASANASARRLAAGLGGLPGVTVVAPTEVNEVFVALPPPIIQGLRADGARFYEERLGDTPAVRLVASWCTSDDEVDALVAAATRHA